MAKRCPALLVVSMIVQVAVTMPVMAWRASICAQNVSVIEVWTGGYNNDSKQWGVTYIDGNGNTRDIMAERTLTTQEGQAMLMLVEAAREHGGLVTLGRYNATCAGDTGDWFDHVTIH